MLGIPSLGLVLRLAPWAIALCAVGVALFFRGEWKDCKASIALEAARAQERVAAAKASDAALVRQLEDRLAPVVRSLQEQANATQLALAKVPSNPACVRTPAADAFDRSVRPAGRPADPGPAGAAGPRAH
ncbi:MAG: hypothetical protein U1E23_14660 [Reyranellaceae bacterium]